MSKFHIINNIIIKQSETMKKYLMMGLATLAFAACVSDKEVTPQTQEEKYEKAFEQLVGGPVNANVNWGFSEGCYVRRW